MRMSNDRLPKQLAPVVQTMDSAIHRISNSETNCNIQWIVIYPVDSVIHRLNNWGLFYSELSEGHRLRARPTLRFKDTLKKSLQNCSIATAHWKTTASNRRVWKQLTRKGAAAYEQAKRRAHAEKRAPSNAGTESRGSSIPCLVCGRICASAFGLRSHLRVHR